MRFETKIYNYTTDEKIIGAEVTVYDEDGDKIDTIAVTDATRLQELEDALDNIDTRYVEATTLNGILENLNEDTDINATTLNGYQGDAFVLLSDIQNNNVSAKPKSHASTSREYGGASTTNFGHVKLRDDLTASSYVSAEALSSHQGKVLNDRIDDVKNSNILNSLRVLIGRYEDEAGEYGTRIEADRGINGIYARILCEDPNFDASKLVLFLDIFGKAYEFTSDKTDANRRLTNAGDGTVKSGRLAIGATSPTGEYILTAFCRYKDGTIYPTTTLKKIIVMQPE